MANEPALTSLHLRFAAVVACCVPLSSCEMYEMQPAAEGEVYVLNKFTGTLERSENGSLRPSAERFLGTSGNCTSDYPHLGFSFSASYRRVEPRIYYRLQIKPNAPSGQSVSVENWNTYFQEQRGLSGADLDLLTADGFNMSSTRVEFERATGVVDFDGTRRSFEAQGSIELPENVANEISTCLIGFYGLSRIPDKFLDKAEGRAAEAGR